MITASEDFNLGRDNRMKERPEDAVRQLQTVKVLLERFFHSRSTQQFEIQILADEVGMGKTFVALGLAYSILAHLKQSRIEPDLDGCYQRVLVLTPNNHALYRKWVREVSEFKRRCIPPENQSSDINFAPLAVDRLDDLAVALRKPGRQPQVIVARMGLFGGDKLLDYDLKRRFTLGVLFRYWSNRFNYENRQRLLKGSPEGWPFRPDGLTDLTEDEASRLPFTEDEFLAILNRLTGKDTPDLENLLELCREVATPFFRNREDYFRKIGNKIIDIYRLAAFRSIQRDFPLLIVDEAHNWKNGPQWGANGFFEFRDFIAPHVRRALLLTATPFQLRPDEMLEILKVSDYMQPCPTQAESSVLVERLKKLREQTIRPVLANAESHSRHFSRAWVRIPRRVPAQALDEGWDSPGLATARGKIITLANLDGVITDHGVDLSKIISVAVAGIDPDIRQFLKESLYLFACNADLSRELGKLVVRHRRQTDHRLFLVGAEYGQPLPDTLARPDGHILHAAPGLDIRGEAELPQYLLMRCVSEMKGGKGRSSLGSDLTGCYSTLHASAEGRRVQQSLGEAQNARRYLDILFEMVNKSHDPKHPKLAAVVEEGLRHWQAGEKVLIFCFRTNTAERLHDILSDRIREELAAGKKRCLGGEGQLKTLRARLTGRDRDLVVLGLDRLLWSVAWARGTDFPFIPGQFILEDAELSELARLSLQFGIEVNGERVDRVFLYRATEHILARRFLKAGVADKSLERLLTDMAILDWIANSYGLAYGGEEEDESEESPSFDERGCHTKYPPNDRVPSSEKIASLADDLRATRLRARTQKQIPILDSYAMSPSLWIGADPQRLWLDAGINAIAPTLREIHKYLWQLTVPEVHESDDANATEIDGVDFFTRALVLQALRRAVLRDSVLLRLLPQNGDLHESGWGELLASRFFDHLPNQHESMAQRIVVFLEDMKASSGRIANPDSARGALHQATLLRDQQFVALVNGSTKSSTRDRIFSGFNTPLLPEVLVCTSVGQEGIDLHRHCRHVVHYDLAWNPAVLEQRTGRADRIGSKTFRERDATTDSNKIFLEIGVPFLAGTYDERMYEELRLRAQTFEVLTGGDFAADHADGQDDSSNAEGKELGVSVLPLPPQMIDDIRVKLQV
ncbi:MAG: DEAD/DEAH box helicase [Planctomycetota bacterium]